MRYPDPRDDDASVREHLRAELERLGDAAPRDALNLPAGSSDDDARRAFRELAKRYHPVRFARRDRDIVKLANEVFLRMRQAHETLIAPRPGAPRGTPPLRAASGRRRPSTTEPPRRPRREPAPKPASGDPRARAERAARLSRQLGYAGTGPARPRPEAEPQPSPPPVAEPPRARSDGTVDGLLASARADEARASEAFRAAVEILDARRPERAAEARQALQSLAAAHPRNRSYRAHFHCALALERAAAGRIADARSEIDRALAFEPGLERARELRRELDAGRGILSRLRKR